MQLERVGPYLWRIPRDASPGMRVPGLVIADIAKEEEHEVDGVRRRLSVHRKGAMRETFVSTCHGAGRRMSRTAAVKAARGAAGGDQGVTDAGRGRPGAW